MLKTRSAPGTAGFFFSHVLPSNVSPSRIRAVRILKKLP